MNDFTKEELAVLKHVLNTNIDGYKDPCLLNKIQSLLDNYCEHETDKEIYSIRNSRLGAEKMINKCKHCGEFYR